MLPMEASAVSSDLAAAIEAKVSGSEVPSATKVMAVIDGVRPMQQPMCEARSPMSAVSTPCAGERRHTAISESGANQQQKTRKRRGPTARRERQCEVGVGRGAHTVRGRGGRARWEGEVGG
jgi:hypothetical protein